MTSEEIRQSYDSTPYPEITYAQTHPDRLATLAALLGLSPAPVENCRVLELGCAGGGNLIPMAMGLPGSTFTGVDFSAAQIEAGQKQIAELGLSNISLRQADILDLPVDMGQFDYIIAHGVYSWVPAEVRDQLMAVCKGSLAANGIAYISYNTYPGWHMLGAIRSMMLYHTRDTANPAERVNQARELLTFLSESLPSSDDPYGTFLNAYGTMINAYSGFVTSEREAEQEGHELLLHDELEAVNDPVYFHQFARHAAEHGLQYLVEADFARVVPTNFPQDVARRLFAMSHDIIEMEQYMDFLRNRTLRQTLLCHDDIAVQRRMKADPETVSAFSVATYAFPASLDGDIHDENIVVYRGPDGSQLSINHPVSKAAMLYLAMISPQAVPFEDLLAVAQQKIYAEYAEPPTAEQKSQDAHLLAANLMQAYSYSIRLVELHMHAPQFVPQAGVRPTASRLARWQAAAGRSKVVNLRHERVRLDETSSFLLPYMDGHHDREMLVKLLVQRVNEGALKLTETGQPLSESGQQREAVASELESTLRFLGRAALLTA